MAKGLGLLACAAWLLLTLARLVPAEDTQPLRYAWKKGSDHYYRLTIKAELESRTEEFVATPLYHVAANDDGELKLLFFGSLTSTRPELFRTSPATFPLAAFLRAPGLPLDSEFKLVVTERGKVVSLQGQHELPMLLGDLKQLPFVLLPKADEQSWTATREVTLSNVTGDFRVPGIVRLEKSIKAEEETSYKITGTKDSLVSIKVDTTLTALERVRQKPSVELVSQATAQFDRKLGAVTSYEAKVDLTVRQKTVTLEVPLTVSLQRVSEEEVAKLRQDADELMKKSKAKIEADAAERKRPIDAAELEELIKSLKSSDKEKVQTALKRLGNKAPDQPDKRVSKAIEPHLASKDFSTSHAAVDAMKNWCTEESVPALLALLDGSQSFARMQAIELLGKFPSKKVADELGLMLNDPGTQSFAARSLKEMGKFAEEPALAALKRTTDKDLGQLMSIVSVLKEVGGAKSLAALKPHASGSMSFMVQAAIKDIELRVERGKLRKGK